MKKVYVKLMFRLIEERMTARFPDFVRYKRTEKSWKDKNLVFCWKVANITNIFLDVWVHPNGYDSFFCGFAWTSINEFPAIIDDSTGYNFPLLDPKSAFDHPEASDGIQRLWGEQGIGEFKIQTPMSTFSAMDYVNDKPAGAAEFARRCKLQDEMTEVESEALVVPLVDELFIKLEQYVIPYLIDYAAYRRKI